MNEEWTKSTGVGEEPFLAYGSLCGARNWERDKAITCYNSEPQRCANLLDGAGVHNRT